MCFLVALNINIMDFLDALGTHSMDFCVALITRIWISVCALEQTHKFMLLYLEQQTGP